MRLILAFIVGMTMALVLVGCGGSEQGTPPEWRLTTTLPGQHLGQTGTPQLYPTTTLP